MKSTAYTNQTESPSKNVGSKNTFFFKSVKSDAQPFFAPAFIQPKLEISKPDDPYEKQADRVADAVVQMPDAPQPVQRQEMVEEEELQMKREPVLQRKCSACEQEEQLQSKQKVQAKSADSTGSASTQPLFKTSGVNSEFKPFEPVPLESVQEVAGEPIIMGDWKAWIGNGEVINNFSRAVTVWSSDNGTYTIPAHSRSESWGEDVDHVRDVHGQWWKIGWNTAVVDSNGEVSGAKCPSPGRGQDCGQLGVYPVPGTGDTIHTKRKVNQPDDRFEQEANVIADKVVNGETSIQRKCAECEKEESLQKKEIGSVESGIGTGDQLSSNLQSSRGSGSRLPESIQTEMSQKMGADFSSVNIHTNSDASQMSKYLGARAFTHGNDIFFNSGEYNPSTKEGKHLLVHELTHVVQQRNFPVIQKQDDAGVPLSAGVPDTVVPAEPDSGWPDRGIRVVGPQTNDLLEILSQCTGLALSLNSENLILVHTGVIDTDIYTLEAQREITRIIDNPHGIIINADNSDRHVGIGAFSHEFPGLQTINVPLVQSLASASGASGGMDVCSPIIHEISEAYSARLLSVSEPGRASSEIYSDAHSYGSDIEDSIRQGMGLEPRAHGEGFNAYLFDTEGDRVYISTTVFGEGDDARTLLKLFRCEPEMVDENRAICNNTHLGEHVVEGEVEVPGSQREALEFFNQYAADFGFNAIEIPENVE